jgi:hypothetical protein
MKMIIRTNANVKSRSWSSSKPWSKSWSQFGPYKYWSGSWSGSWSNLKFIIWSRSWSSSKS